MPPDKARQISTQLACLAANIAEIAEEIRAMAGCTETAMSPSDRPAAKSDGGIQPTLEQVRAVLADMSRGGHTAEVRELLEGHGATRLSEIDPAKYAKLLADAEVLGDG